MLKREAKFEHIGRHDESWKHKYTHKLIISFKLIRIQHNTHYSQLTNVPLTYKIRKQNRSLK